MQLRGFALGALVLAGCGGGDSSPPSDREQIAQLVQDFFADAAADDVEAICGVLHGKALAAVVGRGFVDGRPVRPASEQDCVEDGAHGVLASIDLPYAMKNGYRPSVRRLVIRGDRALAAVKFTGFKVRWRLLRTADGWKLANLRLPVRE